MRPAGVVVVYHPASGGGGGGSYTYHYIMLCAHIVCVCVCVWSKQKGTFRGEKKNVRRRERERKQGDAINAAGLWVAAADKVSWLRAMCTDTSQRVGIVGRVWKKAIVTPHMHTHIVPIRITSGRSWMMVMTDRVHVCVCACVCACVSSTLPCAGARGWGEGIVFLKIRIVPPRWCVTNRHRRRRPTTIIILYTILSH